MERQGLYWRAHLWHPILPKRWQILISQCLSHPQVWFRNWQPERISVMWPITRLVKFYSSKIETMWIHTFLPAYMLFKLLRGGYSNIDCCKLILVYKPCWFFVGAQLSKHADVTSEQLLRNDERTILVFKFMKVCFASYFQLLLICLVKFVHMRGIRLLYIV